MIDIKPKSILEQPIYMLTKATPCPYLEGMVEKRIATDITYNKEEGYIMSIKILKYTESTKEYKIQINENKKKQTSSKSKSNIDRFLKKNNR